MDTVRVVGVILGRGSVIEGPGFRIVGGGGGPGPLAECDEHVDLRVENCTFHTETDYDQLHDSGRQLTFESSL